MLYDQALFPELTRMRAGCGREVVRRHRDRAVQVDWPAARLRDLDRPEDYEAAALELARAEAGASEEVDAGAKAGAGPEAGAGPGAEVRTGAEVDAERAVDADPGGPN